MEVKSGTYSAWRYIPHLELFDEDLLYDLRFMDVQDRSGEHVGPHQRRIPVVLIQAVRDVAHVLLAQKHLGDIEDDGPRARHALPLPGRVPPPQRQVEPCGQDGYQPNNDWNHCHPVGKQRLFCKNVRNVKVAVSHWLISDVFLRQYL